MACNDPNFPSAEYIFCVCSDEENVIHKTNNLFLDGNVLTKKWKEYSEKTGNNCACMIKIRTGSFKRSRNVGLSEIKFENIGIYSFKNLITLLHLEVIEDITIYFKKKEGF